MRRGKVTVMAIAMTGEDSREMQLGFLRSAGEEDKIMSLPSGQC